MSLLFQAILGFKDNQNWSWWAMQNVEALVDILGCKVSVLPFTYLVLPAFNEAILLIKKKGGRICNISRVKEQLGLTLFTSGCKKEN